MLKSADDSNPWSEHKSGRTSLRDIAATRAGFFIILEIHGSPGVRSQERQHSLMDIILVGLARAA
jgi:hypothetical protein